MKLYKRHTRILAATNPEDTRWGFRHVHLKTIGRERFLCATNGKMAICVVVECRADDVDGAIDRRAIEFADRAIDQHAKPEDEFGNEFDFNGPLELSARADGAYFEGIRFPTPDVKAVDMAAAIPKRSAKCIRLSVELLRILADCATDDVVRFYPGEANAPIRFEFGFDASDEFGAIMPVVLREWEERESK